ncbi:dienelactone hydrolase family protein [Mumia sp. ZJ1417]|uniref:dienelactone hydrolase family protein n=1 Tax=Mumia sp. ZJ1417 TaxID=2708082 RepID=UPI0014208CD5|nr:dienelactone hydrolase family protein [Mumia sp. ZJ1417]QMW66272.1 dienelactone hydrolase family protein [Mumia sp. ZJ1417]
MTEIVLFHHALGQTDGFLAFADDLRATGSLVHTPDVFAGRTFPTVDEGVAHGDEVGRPELRRRAAEGVAELPPDVVWAGASLGVVFAQEYAQTRPGARGALLLYAALPVEAFETPWPDGLPVQVHGMADDPWMDWDAEVAPFAAASGAEVFRYPGSGHVFAEVGNVDHDADAAALLRERVLAFLAELPQR